VKKYSTRQALW